jgi:hypothetical protein
LSNLLDHDAGDCNRVEQLYVNGQAEDSGSPCNCKWAEQSPHKKEEHALCLSMMQVGPYS